MQIGFKNTIVFSPRGKLDLTDCQIALQNIYTTLHFPEFIRLPIYLVYKYIISLNFYFSDY